MLKKMYETYNEKSIVKGSPKTHSQMTESKVFPIQKDFGSPKVKKMEDNTIDTNNPFFNQSNQKSSPRYASKSSFDVKFPGKYESTKKFVIRETSQDGQNLNKITNNQKIMNLEKKISMKNRTFDSVDNLYKTNNKVNIFGRVDSLKSNFLSAKKNESTEIEKNKPASNFKKNDANHANFMKIYAPDMQKSEPYIGLKYSIKKRAESNTN